MKDIRNVAPAAVKVDTGVKDPAKVAKSLSQVLSATYELMIATHEVHWNVEGPMFYGIHNLTEAQYTELFAAVDVLAERVRALGHLAPMRMGALIDTQGGKMPGGAAAMLTALKEQHEALARLCHDAIELAEAASDPVTADLATGRSAVHEKAAWMLRAMSAG